MTRLRYLWAVLRHKWFVLVAGRHLGVPLMRLLRHDLSKFSKAEFAPYAKHFYGKNDPEAFEWAWEHHLLHNEHHWQYWAIGNRLYAMPMVVVREMVADWLAAGRAYEGVWPNVNNWAWLKANRGQMRLHDWTADRLDYVLARLQETWQ